MAVPLLLLMLQDSAAALAIHTNRGCEHQRSQSRRPQHQRYVQQSPIMGPLWLCSHIMMAARLHPAGYRDAMPYGQLPCLGRSISLSAIRI